MFDGSYRSKPRAVNLGTNRNRTTGTSNNGNGGNSSNNRKRHSNASIGSTASVATAAVSAQTSLYRNTMNRNSNRDSVLNEAHRLRMERHQKLQYNKAAIRIQQRVRGYQLRKQLVQALYHRIVGDDDEDRSSTNAVRMTVEMSNPPTSGADIIDETTMVTDHEPIVRCDESPLCRTAPTLGHRLQPLEMTTLLNIYLRSQQQTQSIREELKQQSITTLLRQFSMHLQAQHRAKMSLSDEQLLGNIMNSTNKILYDIRNNNEQLDFVLQVRPNTYHILKCVLEIIPTLCTRQQSPTTSTLSSSASSSSRTTILSTTDIMIILSYILQINQFTTSTEKSDYQEKSVHSSMSENSGIIILQTMIGSLSSLIDAGSTRRETTKNSTNEPTVKQDDESLRYDDENAYSSLRMFLMSCVATFIVHQPNMNDWCRPILGTVLLIYDTCHVNASCDVKSSVLSNFQQCLPEIMKVLRPIPPTPTDAQYAGNDWKDEEETDLSSTESFVTSMVSQLISHYRIPLLRVLSLAMRDEIPESTLPPKNHCFRSNINPFEQLRTREQVQIMGVSLYIQFLKYLLLDSTSTNNIITQHNLYPKISDPTRNDNSNHFLLWMIQCAVRGDRLHKLEQNSNDNQPVVLNIVDDGMIENDDEMDHNQSGNVDANRKQPMNIEIASMGRTTATHMKSLAKSSHRRLTKHDLLTLPKLDKKFTDIVKSIDTVFAAVATNNKSNVDTLHVLVQQVCEPVTWLRWGNLLLSTVSDMDDDFHTRDEDMEYKILLRHGQDDYITLLFIFLQATTTLRTQQNALSSPFLKVIPFSSDFMSYLWKYILRQIEIVTFLERIETKNPFLAPQSFLTYETALNGFYRSMSLFSDLFAHHLIAVNDEQFVNSYTKLRSATTGNDEQVILVDDVIVHMRTVLNELFWTKPVCASDLKVIVSSGLSHFLRSTSINPLIAPSNESCTPPIRARLLLTGTKLYNALYERWCRLVTYANFCDESIWWFPAIQSYSMIDNLITQEVDIENTTTERISVTHRRQLETRSRSSVIAEDDPMDIDESSSDDEHERNRPTNLDEESDRLAAIFSDPKMARLLGSIPQVLPFDRRVKMFDSLIRIDKTHSQDEASDVQQILNAMARGEDGNVSGRRSIKIRRDELYNDSLDQLNKLGTKLKGRVHVSFTNQVGTDEAGIDGGGVFKEFIDDLIKDAFSVGATTAKHNLFSATPYQTLTVNVELLNDSTLLPHYEFLGRVLGKAVYESILVEAQFCLPFLNQILGKTNTIEDLKNLDSEYYTNLRKLLTMSKSDIESLGLTFELTIATKSNAASIELLPNGGNIAVTKANVVQYVLLVSHHRLNVATLKQTRAFLRGFRDLIPASWVRLFSAHELQKVISGDDSIQGINVSSLKKVMQYAAGYHPSQPVIQWFWEIIEEMTADQQRKFLKFMTSCSRQPLLGFGSLEPAPCIQQIRLPEDLLASHDDDLVIKEAPLPTSSTCMNLFKLPNYHSKEVMRKKLIAAIESGAGFELT
jgi:ubiquitin-protein ligase E3 C